MRDEFLSNVNMSFLNRVKESLKKCKSFSFSVSFIKKAGLVLLDREIEEALDRGVNGRIITSTYQNFTDIGSLEQFYNWQKRVLERLQNTNNDIYVVAPPGGGKTTPLMAHYIVDIFMGGKDGNMPSLNPDGIFGQFRREIIQNWSNIFHGLLSGKYMNGNQVPKCLFITPIRVLSFEQAEGFQEYFIDLILFLKSLMLKCSKRNNNESFAAYIGRLKSNSKSNIDPIVGNVFGSLGEEMHNKMNGNENRFNSFAKQFTESLICVKTGGGNGQFNDNPDNAIVSIATYGSAKNFISRLSKTVKFIVFDEAHLYMVRPDKVY